MNANIPDRPKQVRFDPEQNENMIGDGALNETLINDKFFNVHNGVSLAGLGYFPPLLYQAITTKVDIEKDPTTNRPLPRHLDRACLHQALALVLTLAVSMILLF